MRLSNPLLFASLGALLAAASCTLITDVDRSKIPDGQAGMANGPVGGDGPMNNGGEPNTPSAGTGGTMGGEPGTSGAGPTGGMPATDGGNGGVPAVPEGGSGGAAEGGAGGVPGSAGMGGN
jgi:hypothetical protein